MFLISIVQSFLICLHDSLFVCLARFIASRTATLSIVSLSRRYIHFSVSINARSTFNSFPFSICLGFHLILQITALTRCVAIGQSSATTALNRDLLPLSFPFQSSIQLVCLASDSFQFNFWYLILLIDQSDRFDVFSLVAWPLCWLTVRFTHLSFVCSFVCDFFGRALLTWPLFRHCSSSPLEVCGLVCVLHPFFILESGSTDIATFDLPLQFNSIVLYLQLIADRALSHHHTRHPNVTLKRTDRRRNQLQCFLYLDSTSFSKGVNFWFRD
jgi:hypothetical protein